MKDQNLVEHIEVILSRHSIKKKTTDQDFYLRLKENILVIKKHYDHIYNQHQYEPLFEKLIETVVKAYTDRSFLFKRKDIKKQKEGAWFLSNKLSGMSLYVDRFCGNIEKLTDKIDYLKELGINVLHLMPLFESPGEESDGGYAVSNFRKVNEKFGDIKSLIKLRSKMHEENMYLMLDIVLNHTSNQHEWAIKASAGEKEYQDYYYMYDNRNLPDQFDASMPEIFPETAPGNFTFINACGKWVMSVFHNYQWDLNYSNPNVLISMLDNIFFYANLGVDILRIDAPAFIWKQIGTNSQNLPQAHILLQLIKLCVNTATPGMALLGEAIVAPDEIIKYFGTGSFVAKECDFAYNATQMALQWDSLATTDTRIMLSGQQIISQKPFGTSWITYTRCHDDIGLGYTDEMIRSAGFTPYHHREFIKNYYSGNFHSSSSTGALFSYNPKTADARISGTLASLCGLEKALLHKDILTISLSTRKILMMQAMSIFIGGLPMLFYGDEVGYTNDYSYLVDKGKSYDNRWMHRPLIDWDKNNKKEMDGTVENIIFNGTKKLLSIRKEQVVVSDLNNIHWMKPYNIHVAGFIRSSQKKNLFCLFNFDGAESYLSWQAIRELGCTTNKLLDLWSGSTIHIGPDNEFLKLQTYGFYLLSDKS